MSSYCIDSWDLNLGLDRDGQQSEAEDQDGQQGHLSHSWVVAVVVSLGESQVFLLNVSPVAELLHSGDPARRRGDSIRREITAAPQEECCQSTAPGLQPHIRPAGSGA